MTEELNKWLRQFLTACMEKPRFKALYCVATYRDLLDAVNAAAAYIDSYKETRGSIATRISRHNGLLVEFKNGSWIRVIAAKENMRATRCNVYAAASNVPRDIREVLLDPMVIDYEQQERYKKLEEQTGV